MKLIDVTLRDGGHAVNFNWDFALSSGILLHGFFCAGRAQNMWGNQGGGSKLAAWKNSLRLRHLKPVL